MSKILTAKIDPGIKNWQNTEVKLGESGKVVGKVVAYNEETGGIVIEVDDDVWELIFNQNNKISFSQS